MSTLPPVVVNITARMRHVPRADRMHLATALTNSRNPLAVRYRDELRMRDGTFKVCRIYRDVEHTEMYVCTDGNRTRTISADEVGTFEHYRDGMPVHASEKKRLHRDGLL